MSVPTSSLLWHPVSLRLALQLSELEVSSALKCAPAAPEFVESSKKLVAASSLARTVSISYYVTMRVRVSSHEQCYDLDCPHLVLYLCRSTHHESHY